MASNDGIEKLIGTWEYVDGEHFDDFLSKIGVSIFYRATAKTVKPELTISQDGSRWTFTSKSTFKKLSYDFEPGVEFDETRLDGETIKSIINFENNKWIHIMRDKSGKESTIIRWVDDEGIQQVEMAAGNVKARRWYKRV